MVCHLRRGFLSRLVASSVAAKFGRKRKKQDVLQVKTIGLKDIFLATGWSDTYTMKACILHVHDLHAADAVYHQTCSVNFHTTKQMPMAQLTNTEDSKRDVLLIMRGQYIGGCKISRGK